jgi:hypothetical protein
MEIFPASSQGLLKSNLNLSFFQQKFDGFLKSRNSIKFVIPAQAGIQLFEDVLDPGFRRGDNLSDFLRDHQI